MTDQNIETEGETKNSPLPQSVAPIMTNSDPKLIFPLPPPAPSHRRNGKVARLPKDLRALINQMLDDGATYAAIIQKLQDDHQISLTPDNLSNWHAGGYQDYLNLQDYQDQIRLQHEAFSELLTEIPATKLPEIALQIATSEIFRRLQELTQQANALFGVHPLGCQSKPPTPETDPIAFTRLLNSLARISREVLRFQQYHDAQAQAAQLKTLDPKRELTEEERTAILDKIDDIFGCKAYRKKYGELPILGPAVLPPNDIILGMPNPPFPPSHPINNPPKPYVPASDPAPNPAPVSAAPPPADTAPVPSLSPSDEAFNLDRKS